MDIIEDIKNRLKEIESIKFTEHVEYKLKVRNIDKSLIIRNLKDPKDLIKANLEKDKYAGEKYELYFRLTKRKGLKVVANFLNKDLML